MSYDLCIYLRSEVGWVDLISLSKILLISPKISLGKEIWTSETTPS